MSGATVDVLLAAYQSELYLAEQLQSLVDQDFPDFRVLIRDGGSTDGTVAIIQDWCGRYPGKLVFVGSGSADAKTNFAALLAVSDAPYIMFCDHDDHWMPDKIAVSLAKCREIESRQPAGTPVLVFSDALVTDDALQVIASSNFRHQRLDPARIRLQDELLQNVPFGNTMCFNRALADKAGAIPEAAFMHDHWMALTAVRFGVVGLIDRPTLYYRQHVRNLSGAPRISLLRHCRMAIFSRSGVRGRIFAYCRQAAAFLERFGAELTPAERAQLQDLAAIPDAGFWARRRLLRHSGVCKHGRLRNIGLYIIL